MTKWARMRRREEKRKAEAEALKPKDKEDTKLPEPEKISDNVKRSQKTQKLETPKASKPNTILSQIPRYIYLVAIFALLSGVFFPMITPGAEKAFNFVIG